MKAFLDSSVVLAWLLHEAGAIAHWKRWDVIVASELLEVEVSRTLDRLRLLGELSEADIADKLTLFRSFLANCEIVGLRRAIIGRAAGSFRTVVATLDAIHLATAMLWVEEREEPLVFLTHDRQLSIAARACGFQVAGL
jgi:predicted nucleic acid-binding protein